MNFILYLASLFYGAAVAFRNGLYDGGYITARRTSIPVVSVGNLTAGGAGKTPVAEWIARYYLSQGNRVAIVSRGYKRKSAGVVLVSDGRLTFVSAAEAGDEPMMLARRNPSAIVAVAERRYDAIEFLVKRFSDAPPDVILLDDGFQHRQLHRDLNVLVVNTASDLFADRLLPLGRLRESLAELGRADIFFLTKVTRYTDVDSLTKNLAAFNTPAPKPVVQSRIAVKAFRSFFSGEAVQLESQGSQPFLFTWAFAFSGIGDPATFMETLEASGLIVEHAKHFPDHHDYTAADIDFILSETVRHGINLIITTEKDYYRLKANDALFGLLRNAPCFYVEIEFEVFEGMEVLTKRLDEVVCAMR